MSLSVTDLALILMGIVLSKVRKILSKLAMEYNHPKHVKLGRAHPNLQQFLPQQKCQA